MNHPLEVIVGNMNEFTLKKRTVDKCVANFVLFFVRTYVFHLLRTYVMILCNWLIFSQNALYLYLGKFRMSLNTLRNLVSRSSIEAFKSVQENKFRVQNH